jgi:hypothetical protein
MRSRVRDGLAVAIELVRYRTDRVARGRHDPQLDAAVHRRAVLGHGRRDRNRLEEREPVLAQVVVVLQPPSRPHGLDIGEQVDLHGRHVNRDAQLDRTRKTLALVPVVVGHHYVRDAVDPEGVEHIEGEARAEVDRHRGADPRGVLRGDEVDVARVLDEVDAARDLGRSSCRNDAHESPAR